MVFVFIFALAHEQAMSAIFVQVTSSISSGRHNCAGGQQFERQERGRRWEPQRKLHPERQYRRTTQHTLKRQTKMLVEEFQIWDVSIGRGNYLTYQAQTPQTLQPVYNT